MEGVAAESAMGKGGWQEFSSGASTARPAAAGTADTPRPQQRVRVQRTKAGKGGKTVTAITGMEISDADARALLKRLKATAGSGGTLKDGVIELQGDQLTICLETLTAEGFRPRQAGG
jgi:translation initiation factor 1